MTKSQRAVALTSLASVLGAGLCLVALARAEEAHQESASVLTEIPEPEPVDQLEDPRDILEKYRPFEVVERIPVLEDNGYYPCTDCHDNESQEPNPIVRELEDEHSDLVLVHGGGRFWCLTCHHLDERDSLRSLKGQPISFDDSYLLCGQCHFQRQKDFFYGAHGKRVGSWRGDRVVTNCTGCHDPHDPAIKPAKPFPPPKARSGLVLDRRPMHHPRRHRASGSHAAPRAEHDDERSHADAGGDEEPASDEPAATPTQANQDTAEQDPEAADDDGGEDAPEADDPAAQGVGDAPEEEP